MSFYSVVNTLPKEANYRGNSLNHTDLLRKLPLSSQPEEFELDRNTSIWINSGMVVPDNNREYGARVNEYLVPVDTSIVLDINKSLLDRSVPNQLVFDMWSICGPWGANIRAFEESLYYAVSVIRDLEDRRNAWLEDRIEKGLELPQEYDCWCNNYDIRGNRSMGCAFRLREARPNHIVSDSLTNYYQRVPADYYMEHWQESCPEVIFYHREEANMHLVNWINRNRYELANLGFCGSNFPDIIYFANNLAWDEANNHDLPVGRKVYKKVDNRTASEKMSDAADQAKANAKAGAQRAATGIVKSPFLRAMIKMLPVLIVMHVLRLLGWHLHLFNHFLILDLAAYICGSNLFVASIYILCVLIYYGRHRN